MGKFDYLLMTDSDSDTFIEPNETVVNNNEGTNTAAVVSDAKFPQAQELPLLIRTMQQFGDNASVGGGVPFSDESQSNRKNVDFSSLRSIDALVVTESLQENISTSISKPLLDGKDTRVTPSTQEGSAYLRKDNALPHTEVKMNDRFVVSDAKSMPLQRYHVQSGKLTPTQSCHVHTISLPDNSSEYVPSASRYTAVPLNLRVEPTQAGTGDSASGSRMSNVKELADAPNGIFRATDRTRSLAPLSSVICTSQPHRIYDKNLVSGDLETASSSLNMSLSMSGSSTHSSRTTHNRATTPITFTSSGHLSYKPPSSVLARRLKPGPGCGLFSFCKKNATQAPLVYEAESPVFTSVNGDTQNSMVREHRNLSQNVQENFRETTPLITLTSSVAMVPASQSLHTLYACERQSSEHSASNQDEDKDLRLLEQLPLTCLSTCEKAVSSTYSRGPTPIVALQPLPFTSVEGKNYEERPLEETIPTSLVPRRAAAPLLEACSILNLSNPSLNTDDQDYLLRSKEFVALQANDNAVRKDCSLALSSSSGVRKALSEIAPHEKRLPLPDSGHSVPLILQVEHILEAPVLSQREEKSRPLAAAPSAQQDFALEVPCSRLKTRSTSSSFSFCTDSLSNTRVSGSVSAISYTGKLDGIAKKQTAGQMRIGSEAHYLSSSGHSTLLAKDEPSPRILVESQNSNSNHLATLPLYQCRILFDLREAEQRQIEELSKQCRDLTFHPRINKYPTTIFKSSQSFGERLSKSREQRFPSPCPTRPARTIIPHRIRPPHSQLGKISLSPEKHPPTVFERLVKQQSSKGIDRLRHQADKQYTYTPEISNLAKKHVSSLNVVTRLYHRPGRKEHAVKSNFPVPQVAANTSTEGYRRSFGGMPSPRSRRSSVFKRVYGAQRPAATLSQSPSQRARKPHVSQQLDPTKMEEYVKTYDPGLDTDDGIARQLYQSGRWAQRRSHHTAFYPSETSSTV